MTTATTSTATTTGIVISSAPRESSVEAASSAQSVPALPRCRELAAAPRRAEGDGPRRPHRPRQAASRTKLATRRHRPRRRRRASAKARNTATKPSPPKARRCATQPARSTGSASTDRRRSRARNPRHKANAGGDVHAWSRVTIQTRPRLGCERRLGPSLGNCIGAIPHSASIDIWDPTPVTSPGPPDILHHRAQGTIMMALAKEFLFNSVRAFRLCEHGAGLLGLPRGSRDRFHSGASKSRRGARC